MLTFTGKIHIIGINPYVLPPKSVLNELFKQAHKTTSPIPVRIKIGNKNFLQNVVRYSGKWRLYLNTPMRKEANRDVGDSIDIQLEFDPKERTIPMHPKLERAFRENKKAFIIFEQLNAYKKKEIVRYINFLKSDDAVDRNVTRAIQFLLGNARFIGRDKP